MSSLQTGDKEMKHKCKCGKLAVWYYMPNDNKWVACDDCVPRGCSCNYEEDVDEQGRKLPCCEWWYNENRWEIE